MRRIPLRNPCRASARSVLACSQSFMVCSAWRWASSKFSCRASRSAVGSAAGGVGSTPPVGGRVLAWLAAKRGARLELTWTGYGRLIGVSAVFWAWSAVTFSLYLRAFPVGDEIGTALLAGGFMVAWGIGFLSVVAPQGIGVFEVGLATLYGIEGIAGFAVVAGGENFRADRGARQRHRYYRKFRYPIEKYHRWFCTGCGRCSRSCMAGIHLKESLAALRAKAPGGE